MAKLNDRIFLSLGFSSILIDVSYNNSIKWVTKESWHITEKTQKRLLHIRYEKYKYINSKVKIVILEKWERRRKLVFVVLTNFWIKK